MFGSRGWLIEVFFCGSGFKFCRWVVVNPLFDLHFIQCAHKWRIEFFFYISINQYGIYKSQKNRLIFTILLEIDLKSVEYCFEEFFLCWGPYWFPPNLFLIGQSLRPPQRFFISHKLSSEGLKAKNLLHFFCKSLKYRFEAIFFWQV